MVDQSRQADVGEEIEKEVTPAMKKAGAPLIAVLTNHMVGDYEEDVATDVFIRMAMAAPKSLLLRLVSVVQGP